MDDIPPSNQTGVAGLAGSEPGSDSAPSNEMADSQSGSASELIPPWIESPAETGFTEKFNASCLSEFRQGWMEPVNGCVWFWAGIPPFISTRIVLGDEFSRDGVINLVEHIVLGNMQAINSGHKGESKNC